MKPFLLLSSLFMALINTTVSASFQGMVGSIQADGKHRLEFWNEGQLEITALEQDDGGVALYDVDGNVLDIEKVEEDGSSLEKRVPIWRIALRFARLIARFGRRVWTFIFCVDTTPFWDCGNDFLDCAASGHAPWACPEGGLCVGAAIYRHCK
ncbi:hypothetical protein N7492_008058 [Penicillium capsulatum]|uniref:Uncharacterized protein n=1 Tax=Penicillium capsulatum TaxID=69766 RepID=A0A9W9HRV9_9EURO|nr:hypothetical protein N7492_008058 [Penicillium capsulatum]KAJ6105467.1 hypothetical protein N7512_008984 [Penicillium capsulatum]